MRRVRRGITTIEVIVGMVIGGLVLGTAAQLTRSAIRSWHNSQARVKGRDYLEFATERMAVDIREGLSVDVAQSGLDYFTVVMPLVEVADEYVIPLADGDRITYYLSDESGAFAATGNILWRQVNGVPDPSWAMRDSRPIVQLADDGLQFTYGTEDPLRNVMIALSAHTESGLEKIDQDLSTAVTLRNRMIADLGPSTAPDPDDDPEEAPDG